MEAVMKRKEDLDGMTIGQVRRLLGIKEESHWTQKQFHISGTWQWNCNPLVTDDGNFLIPC